MTIQQIATDGAIPARFLAAILRDLKQSGITDSVRGKEGGYRLTRPPREVSVGQVVRAVEGRWFPESDPQDGDVFAGIWREAETELNRLLDDKDFQTLLTVQNARGGMIDYSI
jgi:Rrf2 family protein